MAIVLPHGVLFRGAAEGVIRKAIIENKNYLDTVIGLRHGYPNDHSRVQKGARG